MSGIPKIDKLQKTERAQFLVDNLNLPKASGVADAVWEKFQLDHLNDDSIFRIENKSRQIAWSFLSACEAVADAILDERDSIFSSINHEEAKEKIRYAKAVYENLEIAGLPKLKIDNQLDLEFSNGVRLTSFPARPVRGRPRSNWFGDEFHHVQHDRKIYQGSLPIITKGGRVRMASSPMGAQGLFWEIFTNQGKKYNEYTRKTTPWWEIQYFCKNVKLACNIAPLMETEQRVEMFAKDRMKSLFSNLALEDFQQEFEAVFIDESTAWITWDEITANTDSELTCVAAEIRGEKIDECLKAIDKLAKLIELNKVEPAFGVGVDIGRTRNATEIFAVGIGQTNNYPLRLMLTLNNTPFEEQDAVFHKLFDTLPVVGGDIDNGGLGRQLAESLRKKYPFKVREATFSQGTKQVWATDAKMLVQKKKTPIPNDINLKYQIHSVKKLVSKAKNVIFDTDRNEKHHADKFWAWALALSAARKHWLAEEYYMPGSHSFGGSVG